MRGTMTNNSPRAAATDGAGTEEGASMQTRPRAILAAFAVALLAPATASAAVRTVTINDGLDMQDTSPTFTPAPVVRELLSATVSYDDAAGTISASVTFNDATLRNMGVSLGKTCADGEDPTVALGTEIDEQTGGTLVRLTRAGFRDSLTAPLQVSADGVTISASFTDPNLRGLDLRCVSGGANAPDIGGVDTFFGYFPGFEPLVHYYLPVEAGTRLVEHPRKLYLSGTAGAPVHKGHLRWTGWGKSSARTQRVMIGLEYIGPRQSIATGRYHYFRGYIRVYRLIDYDGDQRCTRIKCVDDRLYTRVRYVLDHQPPRKIGRAIRFSGAGPWNVEFCEDTYPCNN